MREIFFGREHRIGCASLLGIPGPGKLNVNSILQSTVGGS
jgi:hypothetical protein